MKLKKCLIFIFSGTLFHTGGSLFSFLLNSQQNLKDNAFLLLRHKCRLFKPFSSSSAMQGTSRGRLHTHTIDRMSEVQWIVYIKTNIDKVFSTLFCHFNFNFFFFFSQVIFIVRSSKLLSLYTRTFF